MSDKNSILNKLASSIPDLPSWVEPRSLLLSGRCQIFGLDERGAISFIVSSPELKLVSVVGFPTTQAIEEAVESIENKGVILANSENSRHVSEALPDWEISQARLHLLGKETRFPKKQRYRSEVT